MVKALRTAAVAEGLPKPCYAIIRLGIVPSPPRTPPVWTLATLSGLPPLESLRFFEAAARHESFARAAAELGVTAAAVAYHVRALEGYLDAPLFERRQRGVLLNPRGQAYLKEVQRILAEVHGVSERQRRQPRRVRIISVEAVAEKWLVPRLAALQTTHPGIAIELETDHRGVDPGSRDFDAWIAYTGATAAPHPVTRREDTLIEETLYEEQLLPVCSPALLAARGQPRGPAELDGWPLLYDLGWDSDWSVLVGLPERARTGPLAVLGLPPVQHAGRRCRPGARGRHRPSGADCGRAREPAAGPRAGGAGRRPRALLPDYHRGLAPQTRSPGIPPMDPPTGPIARASNVSTHRSHRPALRRPEAVRHVTAA